jgi:protein SCO1/2
MTERNSTDSGDNTESPPRQSPLLLIGMLLWVLCLAGIVFGWYQLRLNYLARIQEEAKSKTDDEDDGRPRKTIKLIPGKDGGLEVREVTKQEEEKPWDPNGIEDFSFTDMEGQTVTKQDLLGKPFIISFIFTLCRGPCPNVTKEMREIQDRLKDYDFNLVSLTVDPERDTIEVLKDYAKASGADASRWKFLTGKQADIYGLIHRSFLVPVEEDPDRDGKPGFEIIHSTNIMLVDQTGKVINKFNAQKGEEMAKLRKELKLIAPRKSVRVTDTNE